MYFYKQVKSFIIIIIIIIIHQHVSVNFCDHHHGVLQ
jgi:hypothetical protein